MQDKTPLNENKQPHGFWEVYWTNANLWYKGNFINNEAYGYFESYSPVGKLHNKIYYAK